MGQFEPQSSSDKNFEESTKSNIELFFAIRGNLSIKNELQSGNLTSFKHEIVPHFPVEYNGDIIFKLPPLPIVKEEGTARLDGMDWRMDGNVSTKIATTNIIDPSGLLSFKYVKCMRHL